METNPSEPSPETAPARHRLQFSMRALLVIPLVLVIYVGLAVAIDLYASHVSFSLFGIGWLSDTRYWLIGAGVPANFVTGYIAFAQLRLPGWIVLAAATLFLGLRRSRRAHLLAWLLALAFPISELIGHSWASASGFFPGVNVLLSFNVRIVSAFGFVVGIAAWLIGWSLRGRRYDLAAERRATWFSRVVQIAIWALILAVSVYGWTALASLRQ